MSHVPEVGGSSISTELPPLTAWLTAEASSVRRQSSSEQKIVRHSTAESATVAVMKRWLKPATIMLTLTISLLLNHTQASVEYFALGLVALLLSVQILSPPRSLIVGAQRGPAVLPLIRPLLEWALIVATLTLLALTTKMTQAFSREVVAIWLIATPVALMVVDALGLRVARWLSSGNLTPQTHIIVGLNELGVEFARRAQLNSSVGKFLGFFDHRSPDRLGDVARHPFIGHCNDVADYVRRHKIGSVYIALPISNAPRIAELLRELRDTTASVYFVPNLLAFDLVHARCVDISGMPALSVCDTPLQGTSALGKRITDSLLSIVALAMLWPVLLCIALAVRLSSRGPILFKQKRYGLNGEEIQVYKFRTMTVCEDGAQVVQATRDDRRITPLGKFLRRTSLDELPQILNVLEGKMSFVGPRPHAVAHNEQYRKLISGYMIRHKVRPGITGWAQVNGFRGETATIDKMQQRVRYDLEYLQHWSLGLDLKIIVRTILMVMKGDDAY